jgi:flagellar basal-body rod protein FlgB
VTVAALRVALDAAGLRQQAIAANIANQGTHGYAPQTVDFAGQMEQARRSLEERGSIDPATLATVRPELTPALDASGQPAKVELDMEVAAMAENATRYQALVRALGRHFSILSAALSDGRR